MITNTSNNLSQSSNAGHLMGL